MDGSGCRSLGAHGRIGVDGASCAQRSPVRAQQFCDTAEILYLVAVAYSVGSALYRRDPETAERMVLKAPAGCRAVGCMAQVRAQGAASRSERLPQLAWRNVTKNALPCWLPIER